MNRLPTTTRPGSGPLRYRCASRSIRRPRAEPREPAGPDLVADLVEALARSLRERYATHDIASLPAPFHALAEDHDFWNHTLAGFAVLGAPGLFGVYRLQRQVSDLAIVADSFHRKPLMRILQSAGRYQVLALDRHEVRLFEGDRDSLDEVDRRRER